MRRHIVRLLLAILLMIAVGSVFVYLLYQRDLRAAKNRLASGSHLAQTACGLIEYADQGQDTPILSIHGAGGGYDQGLLISWTIWA